MADGRGRPRLSIGGLGRVTYEPTATGCKASGRTRDAAGKLRRIEARGATEADALIALAAKAAGLGVLAPTTADVATLGDILDRWLEDVADTRNTLDQTRRMYRTKVNRLKTMFGAISLSDLRRARVQVVLNRLAQESTTNDYRVLRGVLNRAMNYGVMLEVLDANHIGATEAPRLAPAGEPVSLTAAQLAVFLEEFGAYVDEGIRDSNRRKAQLATHIIVGLGGLRPSEALAIRHCDIDFNASRVDINGTVVYRPGVPVFRQNKLKADRQRRGLDLSPDGIGMQALWAAREESAPYRSREHNALIGRVEPDESEWMNPSIVGFHFDNVTWRKAVGESLSESGLTPEQLTPRTLRRTVATLVARSEGDERAQEVLAHGNVRTTRSHYITPTGKVVSLETLDAVLKG